MDNIERQTINNLFEKKYAGEGSENGYGITATVFINEDTATKIYSKNIPKEEVFKEAYMLSYVEHLGIDTSKVFNVNFEEGYWVLQMSTVKGQSVLNLLFPRLLSGDTEGSLEIVYKMADLQAKVNRSSGIALPTYKNYAASVISGNPALTPSCREKLLTLLDSLPDGTNVCHGDLHPNNILCDGKDIWTIIDWPEMTSGNPCADASRTYVNMCRFRDCSGFIAHAPNSSAMFADISNEFIEKLKTLDLMEAYLNRYCNIMGIDKEDVLEWIPIQAGMLYGYKEEDICGFLQPYLPE